MNCLIISLLCKIILICLSLGSIYNQFPNIQYNYVPYTPFLSIQILWRDPNSEMLTINEQRMVDDTRISVVRPYVKEWNLKIKDLRKTDQGTYTCVINTQPIQSKLVTLWVRCKYLATERNIYLICILGSDVSSSLLK